MPNPTLSFRLSTEQLARGLQIIRSLEPDYQITSVSAIVKTIYIDYLAKMTLNKNKPVPEHFIKEVNSLISKTPSTTKTLQDFLSHKDYPA